MREKHILDTERRTKPILVVLNVCIPEYFNATGSINFAVKTCIQAVKGGCALSYLEYMQMAVTGALVGYINVMS